jgi:hypothetical protein
MSMTATTAALQQAADGLTYPSETDSPWVALAWPSAQGEPNRQGVLKQGRQKATTPVEEQTVDDFFAPLVQEQDWHGPEEKADVAKYRILLDAVKRLLVTPKVFKVGRRKVAVYVVGQAPEGGWGVLKTTAVET